MDKLKAQYIIVISEVSSYDEYRCLIKSGYKYFEGNFIETPDELQTDEVPANKA